MKAVISADVARQITRGRTPLVPIEYENAVKALTKCLTLDEGKYWSDGADALAAWAKIYRSDETLRKAKMLKLHAYRRMGEIAAELRPLRGRKQGVGSGRGALSGPRTLLKEHGLSVAEADAARLLATLPNRRFEQLLKNPLSPTTARHQLRDETIWHQVQAAAMTLRSRFRHHTAAQVLATMSATQKQNAKELVTELTDWLDEFERRIGKCAAR